MAELLIGCAVLVLGGFSLKFARHEKAARLTRSDAAVMTVALTITTMISIGIGLLATGLYLVAG